MPLPLTLALLALILTKVADIVTTVRGVRRCGGSVEWERNPLARWAFGQFGLARCRQFTPGWPEAKPGLLSLSGTGFRSA